MTYPNLIVALCIALVADTAFPQSTPVPPPAQAAAPSQERTPADAVAPIKGQPEPLETPLEEAILGQAVQCGRAQGRIDRILLRDLLRLEEDHSIPLRLRGMVLAAACDESGYNPSAGGDHKFSKSGKSPVALGILQQWPWWEYGRYGPKINRLDPRQAADAWLAHVAKQVPVVQQRCHFRATQTERIWRVAWVTAVRSPSKKARCGQAPKHWKTFTRWRTAWEPLIQPPEVAKR